jgi:hypothetical protein
MLCSLIARKTAGMHVLFWMDLALKLAPPTPAIFFLIKNTSTMPSWNELPSGQFFLIAAHLTRTTAALAASTLHHTSQDVVLKEWLAVRTLTNSHNNALSAINKTSHHAAAAFCLHEQTKCCLASLLFFWLELPSLFERCRLHLTAHTYCACTSFLWTCWCSIYQQPVASKRLRASPAMLPKTHPLLLYLGCYLFSYYLYFVVCSSSTT